MFFAILGTKKVHQLEMTPPDPHLIFDAEYLSYFSLFFSDQNGQFNQLKNGPWIIQNKNIGIFLRQTEKTIM